MMHCIYIDTKGGKQTFAAVCMVVCCADKVAVRQVFQSVESIGLDRRNDTRIVVYIISS